MLKKYKVGKGKACCRAHGSIAGFEDLAPSTNTETAKHPPKKKKKKKGAANGGNG